MKKYSVYDLNVIVVKKDSVTHKFICKKSFFNNSAFTEILTGENIVPKPDTEVIPLSHFYPPIGTHDITTGRVLMLDKNDILRKYIDINCEDTLERKEVTCDNNSLVNVDEILDKAVSDLFPSKGNWGSDCFDKPTVVGVPYIPCNSRDDEWMAKLIRKNKNLYFISLNRIITYLKNSDLYKSKRHDYELEVVRWQIEWMTSGGDNWIVEEEYGGDFINFDESCDIGFRRGIFNTLTRIGMDPEVVEEGIEKFASMWRDSWIAASFRNRFEPIFGEIVYPLYSGHNVHPSKKLPPVDDEFRKKWIRLRKYEYYQENKDSVDKYGEPDGDMLMSSEEAEELAKEVRRLSIDRQRVIYSYKKERDEEVHAQYKKK